MPEIRYALMGHGRFLAERIPGAQYRELAGEDHVIAAAALDDVIDEVQEFLRLVFDPRPKPTGAGDRPVHRHRWVH